MVDIDSDSQILIYSLSTVSSTFQISIDGKGVVNQADNINGFASTVTAWSPYGVDNDFWSGKVVLGNKRKQSRRVIQQSILRHNKQLWFPQIV